MVFVVFSLFYLINEGLFKCGLYLQGGLYSEVVFHTGLTVHFKNITTKNTKIAVKPGFQLINVYKGP